ncbi:enoyl-CoA hydratase/isomerase family protein [Roseomonas rosulenta]|uniref:enoyl-CoA hydratase/isomerase family protein n=1 Tax=Roseomonas rosulenta TaxID=2748667 RepID=UPI0018E00694
MSTPVAVEADGAVHTIRLTRPDRGNALGPELVAAIDAALDVVLAAGARLVVLRGEGRHFCTGFDLSDLDALSEGDLALRVIRIELLLQRIHALPVTTLALAGGRVFGAGADLFAACDHRVALGGASFAFPGPAFGLVLGSGRLAGLVGDGPARRLLLAGAAIEASQALAMGLATQAVEADAVDMAIGAARDAAVRLDAQTVAALHGRTRRADDAGDLAALARSVARPGLKERILAYRARLPATRPRG